MSDSDSSIVETLADEFAERLRRGESPTISEYAEAHPECAEEIRDLFPSVQMIEQLACRREQQRMAKKAGKETTCPDPEQLGDYRIVRRIGRSRVKQISATAVTSADKYRRDGYLLRPLRNLYMLGLYTAGVSPRYLSTLYR